MASGRRSLVIGAYVAVSILWGSTYLGIRIALEGFAPFFIGAARFIVAGAVLYGVARARGEGAPTLREWRASTLTGALFFVIGNGFLNFAEQSISTGLASVLLCTMPLWITVFSRLFGESVSRGEVIGVALGLAGVAVLNIGGELRASPGGAAMALLAPMGWALGSTLSKRLALPGGLMRTATQMAGGGVALLLVSLARQEPLPAGPSWRAMAALAYLCVFGSLIGFTAFTYLLEHTRPAVATSYAYVNPVIAVLLGVLFAGERFGLASLAGASLVLAAVVLVVRARASGQGAKAMVSQQNSSAAPFAVQPLLQSAMTDKLPPERT